MHVIVLMAGRSRRFLDAGYTLPKALLDIDGRPMIAHVLEMFDVRADTFHIVANQEQLGGVAQLSGLLHSLAAHTRLTVVPPHDEGPVYSALQVRDIQDDEEVIVTYCDFMVDWDYGLFRRTAHGHAGAIPVFRGFHPASLGDTRYAYLRVSGNRLLELREKRSFTRQPQREHASAGIYYFSSWGMYRKYAQELLRGRRKGAPEEAYTSLLFNLMVRDGLDVLVHEVKRFICWGTPGDYEVYRFWNRYFARVPAVAAPAPLPPAPGEGAQINLIPMAGRGARFKREGYRVAKPLIQVRNRPMVVTAVSSFPPAQRWIFLPRAEDLRKHPIEKALRDFAPDCAIVSVRGDTAGPAATCLLAHAHVPRSASLFIASCDYQTFYDRQKWRRVTEDASVDGAIWTFRTGHNPVKDASVFAYCALRKDGVTVERVVEKQTISGRPSLDPMAVGSFWYRRASDFVEGVHAMMERGMTVGGEYYVGTSINFLLEKGRRFVIFDVDQWISFGDPLELRIFEYWEDHWHEKSQGRLQRAP